MSENSYNFMTFHDQAKPSIAFLVPSLDWDGIFNSYVKELIAQSDDSVIPEVVAYSLFMNTKKVKGRDKLVAPSAAEQREFLSEMLTTLKEEGIKHVLVSDPKYYKTLTGSAKAASDSGALKGVDPKHFSDFVGEFKITYVTNYRAMFFDPIKTKASINLAANAVITDVKGAYVKPGDNIIKFAWYPQTNAEILNALEYLSFLDCDLTADIETFSLHQFDAGIGTISFAWNKHEGIAFQVDRAPGIPNNIIRDLLRNFFERRARGKRKLFWHKASFDATVLIRQLYQEIADKAKLHITQYAHNLMTNSECTLIISYLATNSCSGNQLGLKQQALEFAGNYAVDDIKDITKIPVADLLEYNLVDCLSTWYTLEKNYPKMVADQQEGIYRDIFLPSLLDVVDMQLTGLPVDMDQVAKSKAELEVLRTSAMRTMLGLQIVKDFKFHLDETLVAKKNAEYKKKRITTADVDVKFNPGSANQLQELLFDPKFMGLPVVNRTDSGAPSTKAADLKSMRNHTTDKNILDFLTALADFKDTDILLTTFIPALENARMDRKGNYYMFGNFNLGGTVSGRLSSSGPNLQNIPSKSRLAKYIKLCIRAPNGYIFVGIDFDSLEDRISALLTKDPNKLKVYTDGFDGHCLRALSYFGDEMTGINPDDVASVNSIADLYPDQRQRSKGPTFLLTYQGTYMGIVRQFGIGKDMAKQIEFNYHGLYVVSDEWVASKLEQATHDGYITCAFGLRVRTPILKQVILGNRRTPSAAKAEGRTAGNALGQSWGLLNNRAASEFMGHVRSRTSKGQRAREVLMCAQIHDAQYVLMEDDVETLLWVNHHLTQSVTWQDHPDIDHPDVRLSGQVDIFYPTWNESTTLPLNPTIGELEDIAAGIREKYPL